MAQTAIVTGTASGMGQATAQLLIDEGWNVLALDLKDSDLCAGTGWLHALPVDITDRTAVADALAEGIPAGTAVDLVANVAGIYPPSTLDTFTEELYRFIFDVNVLGSLNVAAEARKRMHDGSALVNFASVDAFTVSPGQLLYGASKAAIVMVTKTLALELAPEGIRVNAVAPGWVDTPGNQATGRMTEAAKSIPLQRVALPEEIARWVLTLGSRTASFMTGETIVLSGGDVIR
ncbi:SDR family NAD(P)-dependent oxidoreductase [Rhodococcus wratislaviensis]|uniref:SDR family NAD(P)-dependent oxidoreductase n=1 Tax=Rhodococcus wratislaviensis TaxID=44752 RepID=UPI003517B025